MQGGSEGGGGGERKFMNLLSLLSWLWPILSDSSGRAPQ